MVDYAAAIKKPFEDMETLLIGIVISAIPIINLLTLGYLVGAGRNLLNGKNALPKWDPEKLVQYIKDMIFGAIIYIIYMIPAGIVLAIGGGLAIAQILASAGSADIMSSMLGVFLTGGIFALIGGLLYFVGELLCSMGLFSYLKANKLKSAFQIKALVKKILTVNYWSTLIVLVIYSVIVSIVASIIAGIIAFIPILGLLIAPMVFMGIVLYVIGSTATIMLTQVYKETP